MRCFYETESEHWAGLGQLGSFRVRTTLLSGIWLIIFCMEDGGVDGLL